MIIDKIVQARSDGIVIGFLFTVAFECLLLFIAVVWQGMSPKHSHKDENTGRDTDMRGLAAVLLAIAIICLSGAVAGLNGR